MPPPAGAEATAKKYVIVNTDVVPELQLRSAKEVQSAACWVPTLWPLFVSCVLAHTLAAAALSLSQTLSPAQDWDQAGIYMCSWGGEAGQELEFKELPEWMASIGEGKITTLSALMARAAELVPVVRRVVLLSCRGLSQVCSFVLPPPSLSPPSPPPSLSRSPQRLPSTAGSSAAAPGQPQGSPRWIWRGTGWSSSPTTPPPTRSGATPMWPFRYRYLPPLSRSL